MKAVAHGRWVWDGVTMNDCKVAFWAWFETQPKPVDPHDAFNAGWDLRVVDVGEIKYGGSKNDAITVPKQE